MQGECEGELGGGVGGSWAGGREFVYNGWIGMVKGDYVYMGYELCWLVRETRHLGTAVVQGHGHDIAQGDE